MFFHIGGKGSEQLMSRRVTDYLVAFRPTGSQPNAGFQLIMEKLKKSMNISFNYHIPFTEVWN